MHARARSRHRNQLRRRVRLGLGLGLSWLAALALPAAASAAISFGSLSAAPASTQAGAHSNFSIHVGFTNDSGDSVKDIRIGLPPGQIGDPNATALCTVADLNADTCSADTAVGDLSSTINALGIPLPVDVTGTLYNLTPQPGEPARFGIVLRPVGGLLPKIVLQSAVELRSSDFGLDTVINGIPNSASGIPIQIASMDVTLHGTAGNPAKPFVRNPTSCSSAVTHFSAVSYNSATPATGQASFTPTGCGSLDFSPTFSATVGAPGQTTPSSHTVATTAIAQDADEAGLRNAQVILPHTLGPNSPKLNDGCPAATFQTGSCPAASIIGSAEASSPLLSAPLSGPVVLVADGGFPQIGLDLHGQLAMQLYGSFVFTPDGPGVAFDGLPDIPIANFALTFAGAPDGLLLTFADLCNSPAPVFTTNFTGFNDATQSGQTAASIEGCEGAYPKIALRLKRVGSSHPRLRLLVSNTAPVQTVALKLPARLRFAGAPRWMTGVKARVGKAKLSASRAKHNRRAFSIKLPSGSKRLRALVGRGALKAGHSLKPGAKLRFRVRVQSAGRTTTRTLLVRAGK